MGERSLKPRSYQSNHKGQEGSKCATSLIQTGEFHNDKEGPNIWTYPQDMTDSCNLRDAARCQREWSKAPVKPRISCKGPSRTRVQPSRWKWKLEDKLSKRIKESSIPRGKKRGTLQYSKICQYRKNRNWERWPGEVKAKRFLPTPRQTLVLLSF